MAANWLERTMDSIELKVESGYPVLVVRSFEHERVLHYLMKLYRRIRAHSPGKWLFRWDSSGSLKTPVSFPQDLTTNELSLGWLDLPQGEPFWAEHVLVNPLEVLACFASATTATDPKIANSILVAYDLHPYLNPEDRLQDQNALFIRALKGLAEQLRVYYEEGRKEMAWKTLIIVVPPSCTLTRELERDLVAFEFPLPEKPELVRTLRSFIDGGRIQFPERIEQEEVNTVVGQLLPSDAPEQERSSAYQERLVEMLASAAIGLTFDQFRQGLNELSVLGKPLSSSGIDRMLDLKATAISSPALEYIGKVSERLGGLGRIRRWIRQRKDAVTTESVRERFYLPAPRGLFLVGASGAGKSSLAKLVAAEFALPLVRLSIAALYDKYLGETEARMRMAFRLCEILSPLVLWIDELEKSVSPKSEGDSGVSARLFGELLTWLAEKEPGVFVVATANDSRRLPSELLRKGRFDEIVWLDLPSQAARKEIFRVHLERHSSSNYLQIDPNRMARLARDNGIVKDLTEDTPLDTFCGLLSQPQISPHMTGAEVRSSIEDALWRAQSESREHPAETRCFTETVVLEAVKDAATRAMYKSGSRDAQILDVLRQSASGWLSAD